MQDVATLEQMPFKSRNRFSAVRLTTDAGPRLLVFGAPETLGPNLDDAARDRRRRAASPRAAAVASRGGRPANAPLGETLAMPLMPIALVALADELRPEAAATLAELARQGIEFKVVSGDNPETVRGTVDALLDERRGLSPPDS